MGKSLKLKQALQAVVLPNRLQSAVMGDIQVCERPTLARLGSIGRALTGLVAMSGFVMVVVLGSMALSQSGAGEPVIIAMLAVLAAVGVFFLLGLLSGYLRFNERARELELVKSVADSLDGGIQVVTPLGSIVYSNAAARAICGTAAATVSFNEALSADPQAAEALFRLTRAAECGETRQEEFCVRSDGPGMRKARWLRASVRPFAPSGLEEATVWQVSDITQARAREIEVASALEAALRYYDSMPVGVFCVAPDGRIVHFNATLAALLGVKSGRIRAQSLQLTDIVAGDVAALILSAGRPAMVGGGLDVELLGKDGRAFPVRLMARRPAGDSDTRLTVVVFDRTSEPFEDLDAAPAEARLTRLFQSAPFGIATADASGRILSSNVAFARMFHLDGHQAVTSIFGLVTSEADGEVRHELEKGFERTRAGLSATGPIEVSIGAEHQFTRRIYMSPLTGSAGAREAAILYVIDATEQKALEVKFAQSQKMEAVGQLAGGIAHDFNNVLTAIIGFSDLLLQTHRPTDPAFKDIMNIKSSANRAAGLVRQLLAFSRRQTLQAEVLQLGEVITDLHALINRAMGEKIELKILSGRDLWYVKADRTQFEQVLINLAVNARDAMSEGGRLTIRTRNISERDSLRLTALGVAAGEYVAIEVEDTGTGMSGEVMAKIFEPFFSTKEVGKGTGLGLSTVYGIVKQTGGYIFPESEIGKGTTFRVYLPRYVPDSEDEVATTRGAKKKEMARDLTGTGRVLLVEDEDAVRSFAVRALSRQGYEVLEAASGAEALKVMAKAQGKVDLVVSDVIMPEMDGPTMLKELRKTKPDLKIIFVSGYPDDAFTKSLNPDEQFAFLPKPFTLPQLAAKVKEQFGR
jgi:two-component system cell cycle sensor histidine kinase/response regulator CckA